MGISRSAQSQGVESHGFSHPAITVRLHRSLSGFIASDLQQSVTENGDTRFYVWVDQVDSRGEDNGPFFELDLSFHDLVAHPAPRHSRASAHAVRKERQLRSRGLRPHVSG